MPPTPTALDTPPDSGPDGRSIAEVAAETGIQKDTLRVWEKRYGFPVPHRDAHGERRYGADQLQRLGLIKRLLDAGHRPGGVVPLPASDLERLLAACADQPAKRRSARARAAAVPEAASHADWPEWLSWLQGGNVNAMQQALAHHALRHGLVQTIDGLLTTLGRRVGESWFAGELTVYQEHLYTEAVMRFLQESLRSAQPLPLRVQRTPRVLLSTLPGEQHTMGLLMAECVLALEGCEHLSLGRDTPLADVVQAALDWRVDVVALSVSPLPAAAEVCGGVTQLASNLLPQSVSIWVGGSSPHLQRRGMPEGVCVLSRAGDLVDEVRMWRQSRSVALAG